MKTCLLGSSDATIRPLINSHSATVEPYVTYRLWD